MTESPTIAVVSAPTTVHVEPTPGGWRLRCDPCGGDPLMFFSARKAEAQARALVRRLTALGLEVRMEVHNLGQASDPGQHAG